jgi:hypothetical protein
MGTTYSGGTDVLTARHDDLIEALKTLRRSVDATTAIRPGFVSLSLQPLQDTAAYADGDTLFDFIAIPGSSFPYGTRLDTITVLDEDDQGVALDLMFAAGYVLLGTLNAAPSITDANARAITEPPVSIATGDYIDNGGNRLAGLRNVGLVFGPSTVIFVAGVTRGGTPTYTAAGLKFKFGFVGG